jgi:hypothetical protein
MTRLLFYKYPIQVVIVKVVGNDRHPKNYRVGNTFVFTITQMGKVEGVLGGFGK